jgi:hypothetical protein
MALGACEVSALGVGASEVQAQLRRSALQLRHRLRPPSCES